MSQAIYYLIPSNKPPCTPVDFAPKQAITIPIGNTLNKATLLSALATACNFPSYFAHNWDSAWDCLTDSEVTHLQLNMTQVTHINTEDFDIFKDMIEDAFKDFGKPQLWIVVSSENK